VGRWRGKIDDKEERRRNMGKESKKITRRGFLKAGLVAGGAAATGFPMLLRPAHAQVKEIKIGLLAPLTGLAAVWGQRTFNAYELAAELINQAGGIKSMGGAKVKVVVADTENKPEVAAIQAERLISDRDLIVLSGSNQSSATMVASQITERNRLCFITGSDPLDEITGRGFQFTYRATLLMGDYVRDLIYYARDMGKKTGKVVKKMANLSENSVAGIASGKAVSKYANEVGFEVVDSSTYDPGSTRDFTGYISKYKSAGIDFVVSFSRPQDAIIITRTMKELNFNPLAFGGIASGLTTSEYGKILGKDSNFIIAAANFTENAENNEVAIDRKSVV
jgi:branched-chain amino acid transport system substrate-binding protein